MSVSVDEYRHVMGQRDESRDQPCSRRGVLLTHDLIFSTKVTSTARALGLEVTAAADLVRAAELCLDKRPGCVFIDLGVPDLDITAAVAQLRSAAGSMPTVAYGSHVDKARLDEARAAGCDEVLPRSRFSAELPALLRRYLDTAEQGGKITANWTRRVNYASFLGDECDDIAIHQPSGQRDKSVPVAAHAELNKRIQS